MSNQIMVLQPYWHCGTWVFDDPATELVREAFVSGTPEILNHLIELAGIPNTRDDGFRLLFSAGPFPGCQQVAHRQETECGGWWYKTDDPEMRGWLCPALFNYFEEAPEDLYVKVEALG